MNGEVCCILQICCPPEARAEALAKELIKDGVFDLNHADAAGLDAQHAQAKRVADFIFQHFDLAPAGTLGPLVSAIATVTRLTAKR